MNIELYMISVNYDHQSVPVEGKLPVRSINIGDKIKRTKEGKWLVPNHYRQQNESRIRQVGFRFVDTQISIENVFIKSLDSKVKKCYSYSQKYDVWFDESQFSPYKLKNYYAYDSDYVTTGITMAGAVKLWYQQEGRAINDGIVYFIPSALDIQDYEEMVSDLYHIHEDLVRDDRNVSSVGLHYEHVACELEKYVQQLKLAVQAINSHPQERLTSQSILMNEHTAKKFNMRIELQKYINPGKGKYATHQLLPTSSTYENKLVKQMLMDIVKYTEAYEKNQPFSKMMIKNIENERKAHLKNGRLADALPAVGLGENALHTLKSRIEVHEQEEAYIKAQIQKHATCEFTPTHEHMYVELSFDMKGPLQDENQYGFYQTIESETPYLSMSFKYDSRKSHFQANYYKIAPANGTSFFNSYFGKVHLKGLHLPSYLKLHDVLQRREKQELIICGWVTKRPNSIDGIAVRTYRPEYHDYQFHFAAISEIRSNQKNIEVSMDHAEMLATVAKKFPIKLLNIDEVESTLMAANQLEHVEKLLAKKNQLLRTMEQYQEVRHVAEQLLQLPIFKSISLEKRIVVQPTQLFIHNSVYKRAWQAILGIQKQIGTSLLTEEGVNQLRVGKVEGVFEVWSLYKLLQIWTNDMGWKLENYRSAADCLKSYIQSGSLSNLKGFSTTLSWNEWTLEVYYEPRIDLVNGNYLTPDFVLKFRKGQLNQGLVILDAKYRNYDIQGAEQWKKDVNEVAISKYGNLQAADSKWQLPVISSSILHSDYLFSERDVTTYFPYHVLYNEEMFGMSLQSKTAHKYSSIAFVPSMTYQFKNLMKSVLELKLDHYNVCWQCGEGQNIREKMLFTDGGNPKYHYTCGTCDEFWVKVHCSKDIHHRIIKHVLNYHLELRKEDKWFVICPHCGDGREISKRTGNVSNSFVQQKLATNVWEENPFENWEEVDVFESKELEENPLKTNTLFNTYSKDPFKKE